MQRLQKAKTTVIYTHDNLLEDNAIRPYLT